MRATAIILIAVSTVLTASHIVTAGDLRGLPLPLSQPTAAVSPLLDDAGLNDVQLVGETHAWAVGDRGAIWHSTDGGRQWELVSAPVDCSLRSVCFVTDRVGWIAGGGVRPHGAGSFGIVLQTTDGGETWKQVGGQLLPLVHEVQFFDLDEGIAVGEPSSVHPTGVFTTSDGGKSWQSVNGPAGGGWRCAAFLGSDQGFVAGRLGRYASVAAGQVQPSPAGASGLRGITDVTIDAKYGGWLCGDGGLLMQTKTGGISWNAPSTDLPRELRDLMDLKAVDAVGDSVWVTGQPGSVIWHSADRGENWTAQQTGNPLPLEAMDFSSPTHGCAVGAMGRIVLTSDGGKTWIDVRGENRRAAMLAVHAHESSVSVNLTTKYGHELGYRMVTSLVARRDIGPDGEDGRTLELRLDESMSASGGTAGIVDWAFPIAAPELDRDQTELVREWELLTDGRLREKMLGRLVAMICTWRPDVIVLDEPAKDDAATKLLVDAVRLAVHQAAQAVPESDQRHALHLTAWEVKRIFQRLPAGSGGTVRLEAHEFLPRLGKSVTMAAAEPYRLLAARNTTIGRDEAFVFVPRLGSADEQEAAAHDLFSGLSLTPGGDARRELAHIDDADFDRMQKLAQHQRNFAAYASQMLDDSRHAAQLIGQTKDIIAEAPPEQAAVQLFHLADEYRRRGEWEHAQAILVQVAQHYPHEPAAREAMSWLLAFWASAEVGWQRLRNTLNVDGSRTSTDGAVLQANLQRAIDQARAEIYAGEEDLELERQPDSSPIRQASASGQVRVGGTMDQRLTKQQTWLTSADRLTETFEKLAPAEAASASRRFLIAALHRKQNRPRLSDEIYASFLNETADGPWNRVAAGELWLSQPSTVAARPTAVCRRTATPPMLDGRLDDECWRLADVIRLRNEAEHRQITREFVEEVTGTDRAIVQWAYDGGFLYIAARIPRVRSLSEDRPELPGRTDDADLTGQDRLSFAFDTDRDYSTFYEIEVDQRGWSADACWENRSWNCQRYIAADADDREWRIEMAIPFEELTPQAPKRGETWAGGVSRIMPTVGVESWTHPAGSRPRPEGFGLLRFD